jgi:hypothetical protein
MEMTSADDHDRDDEPRGGLVRRVLSPGPRPEERLEELLMQRRRELDEHAARLHESIAELERREELLRDSRASVERMLRLGTSDLEAREAELSGFLRDLTEREARLSEAEADVARRRQDLGAVELKRAALERRERAVEARERAVEAREEQIAERQSELDARTASTPQTSAEPELVELAFVPGDRYRLVEIDPTALTFGFVFEVEDAEFVVSRIARSPLPGDTRRCAYLVRGTRGESAPAGSS